VPLKYFNTKSNKMQSSILRHLMWPLDAKGIRFDDPVIALVGAPGRTGKSVRSGQSVTVSVRIAE
jgi:hypothetical protein